jgi:signal transduction histidine kinase
VIEFAVAGLVVAALLTVITGILARRSGAETATRSFERLAAVVAGSVLAPQLTPEVRQGVPEAEDRLRRAVEPLLAAGPVVGITVRDGDGRVVWSDMPGSIGTTQALAAAEKRTLADGKVVSDIGERATTSGRAEMLTASVGVRGTDSEPLLVQLAERHDDMEHSALSVWQHFAPAALGALLVLELVQIPLAARLARRVRGCQEAEAALLEAAVAASDVERRRIAGEVHDNIVPGLTGLAYELDAARLRDRGVEGTALLARTADGVRRSIADLRALSVHLSHSRLPEGGLVPALGALADRMKMGGIRVNLEASELDALPDRTAEVLYRCAQETLRNVAAHSNAEQVDISVVPDGGAVTMIVDDDGRGFDQERLTASEGDGHLGLRALGALAADAGGSLTTFSAPGQGTRVVVRIPLDPLGADILAVR